MLSVASVYTNSFNASLWRFKGGRLVTDQSRGVQSDRYESSSVCQL
jgi:hypothetical protein